MARLSDMDSSSRRFVERYPFPDLETPALHRLPKPLKECRIALVTTAGLHLREDKPFSGAFSASDCSFRQLPASARLSEIAISHTSKEFDQSGIMDDLNAVYPIDRLTELVKEGKLGSLASFHYSFMGSLPRVGELRKKTAPEVAALLRSDSVDLALLTPV